MHLAYWCLEKFTSSSVPFLHLITPLSTWSVGAASQINPSVKNKTDDRCSVQRGFHFWSGARWARKKGTRVRFFFHCCSDRVISRALCHFPLFTFRLIGLDDAERKDETVKRRLEIGIFGIGIFRCLNEGLWRSCILFKRVYLPRLFNHSQFASLSFKSL